MKVDLTADDVMLALSQGADERRRYAQALYEILALPTQYPGKNPVAELAQWRDAARRFAQDALGVGP